MYSFNKRFHGYNKISNQLILSNENLGGKSADENAIYRVWKDIYMLLSFPS